MIIQSKMKSENIAQLAALRGSPESARTAAEILLTACAHRLIFIRVNLPLLILWMDIAA